MIYADIQVLLGSHIDDLPASMRPTSYARSGFPNCPTMLLSSGCGAIPGKTQATSPPDAEGKNPAQDHSTNESHSSRTATVCT